MLYYCFIPIVILGIIYITIELIEKKKYIKVEKKGLIYLIGSILTALILIAICVVYYVKFY